MTGRHAAAPPVVASSPRAASGRLAWPVPLALGVMGGILLGLGIW